VLQIANFENCDYIIVAKTTNVVNKSISSIIITKRVNILVK